MTHKYFQGVDFRMVAAGFMSPSDAAGAFQDDHLTAVCRSDAVYMRRVEVPGCAIGRTRQLAVLPNLDPETYGEGVANLLWVPVHPLAVWDRSEM